MIKYIIRRLVQAIPTFFGITLISYLIMTAAPGDPVSLMTFDPTVTMEQVERLGARLGTNDPWPVQYLRWLVGDDWMEPFREELRGRPDIGLDRVRYGILRGDFGNSFFLKMPAIQLIGERLPATLELGVAVLVVSLSLGIPIGILAAVRHGGKFDNATRILAVIGNAVPNFWLGLILILIFGAWLGLLPMGGRCAQTRGGCPPVYQRLEYLIMPVTVLSLSGIAGYSRYMRASMLEQINSDYIRTAKAKGLPANAVWFKHGARNALIPIATFLGPALVGVLGGAVVTEQIFTWPGLGLLLITSITRQDYPIIMASVVIASLLTILGYILSDVLYAVVDPRIRF